MIYLVIAIIVVIGIYITSSGKKSITEDVILTDEFKDIINIIENTKESIFIAGKAGTGKSTLLRYFTSKTKKKFVILAPTGVAAMNVKGQTIHSFFKFLPKLILPHSLKPDFTKTILFKNIEVVIIDEISMVRADLMEGIDRALRLNRNNLEIPFGGVQMVFIGDLFQLPPVVPSDLRNYFTTTYDGEYFFNADVFRREFKYYKKELTTVFRQKDEQFISMLNKIRINKAEFDDFALLNSRHIDNIGENYKNAVFLTTTNANVKKINKLNLEKINSTEFVYKASLTGTLKDDFDRLERKFKSNEITEDLYENSIDAKFPTNVFLKLKVGAQIMMIKNDSLKRWVNGSVGKVKKLDQQNIWIELEGKQHKIEIEQWEEISYNYDAASKQIKEQTKGTFRQFPIKLAWAMTIHKSQGKTFDKIVIDIGNGAFSHGQTYVALSRCKTLEGITLNKEIKPTDIIVDDRVFKYFLSS